MSAPRFADIVFPLAVDQAFTYAVPEALRERARPGMRALAPMRNRIEAGYIVAVSQTTAVEKVRPLVDLPDAEPVFTHEMLSLCRWMADYYCCAWGEALQSALPAGVKGAVRVRYRIVDPDGDPGRMTEKQTAVLAALRARGPLTARQLGAAAGGQALSNTLLALVKRGVLAAESDSGAPGVSVLTETWARLIEANVPETEALAAFQRRAPKQAAVYLDLLHGAPERAATELYDKHHVDSVILAALEKRGLIDRVERELYRAPDMTADPNAVDKHPLNAEQRAAFDAICAAAGAHHYRTFLLRGITGSGKTEVYLQAIERVLALGRDAIILVPEISLTPQTVGRFYARFKRDIAVLHSGLSHGERADEWRRAQRGEVRIVVGARSAVFAPLPRLGMIIVDEEHDNSYKQGESPRYHGRDVAIMRARALRAVCVLGSATPSVESYHNSETGKSVRLDLTRRATRGVLPAVHLVDMREEPRTGDGPTVLSKALEEAVHARITAREQVILLLNRRGFAPVVLCPQCGWIAGCDNCQVSMTYHSSGGALKCHYCNAERGRPGKCDKCGFAPLVFLGLGTQKGEDYLMRAFTGARVERMDADTTAGKGGHAKILGRFAKGEIDILIGTQMLAKGHDYPGVTLVGVINADSGLALPEFRAAEQTFQLLTQVAGRAGRGDKPGEVFIQTFRPRHYAIAAAAAHNYPAFYEKEIGQRREAGYPPFRRMAHFLVESEDPELVERESFRLRNGLQAHLRENGLDNVELVGPAPAAVRRVNKYYRWNLAAFSKSSAHVNAVARAARDRFAQEHAGDKVRLKIDLDPHGMY
jgi:primosomal protein N' (replication factor Y)